MLFNRYLSDNGGAGDAAPEETKPDASQKPPGGATDQGTQETPGGTKGQLSELQPDQPQGQTLDALPDWAQELIKGLRGENASHRQAKKEAEKAAETAARKMAEEQGKFKELYQEEVARREAAESEARRLELGALKSKVAAEVGLPPALATRLQGETEDELKVDAQAVLAALPKAVVGNDALQGIGGAGSQAPAMSDEEIREFAARYNVDPKFVRPEMFRLPKKT